MPSLPFLTLWPAELLTLLSRIYGFILLCSTVALVHPRLRRPEAKSIREAIHSWWPPSLIGGVALLGGRWVGSAAFAVVSAWGLFEYLRMQRPEDRSRLSDVLAYAFVPVQFAAAATGSRAWLLGAAVAWMAAVLPLGRLAAGGPAPVTAAARLQLGLLWIVFPLSHVAFALFAAPPAGPAGGAGFLLLLLLCVMTSDAGQYVAGKAFGRHPLAPRLSPKKTWEGLAGGMVITMVVAGLAAPLVTSFGALRGAAIGALLCGVGTLGDLMISAVKREAGVKDSGRVLPGQGGVLDRCDSFAFTAPLYVLVVVPWPT